MPATAPSEYNLIFRLLKTLVTPFRRTKAYRLGIIDDEGNVLKKHKDLETFAEKNAYSNFERICWNIKKLIMNLPINDLELKKNPVMRVLHPQLNTGVTSVTRASYLMLRENEEFNRTKTFSKFIWEDLEQSMLENAPVNSASSGNIAGLPPDDPPVSKSAQKKHRKKKKKQNWITFKDYMRLFNGSN